MYFLVTEDCGGIKKPKGVNKNVVDTIRHKEYIDMLFSKGLMRHSMKKIQIKLHRVWTYDTFRISLPCFDDKCYILDDGVGSLAYFHMDI